MKNSIAFLSLLLFLSFGCNKADNPPTSVTQESSIEDAYPNVVGVIERDGSCCCSIVVSSTYFGGLTICGVAGEGSGTCKFCTTTCGASCGGFQSFPQGHNNNVCLPSGCPFKVKNSGSRPIQIYFICPGGNSSPVWIPVGGSIIYTNDCSGTFTVCTEAPCG